MTYHRSSKQIQWTCIWIALFLVVIGLGIALTWHRLYPFFLTRPWLNGAIVGLGLAGLAICLWEIMRLLRQSQRMDYVVEHLDDVQSREEAGELLSQLRHGLIRERCETVLKAIGQGPSGLQRKVEVIAESDADSEEVRGDVVRYLIGVLVFLGLLGTFWGLLVTVLGVKDVLEVLQPTQAQDPAAFIAELKTSIGGLLGGMSTAFSTSLFGLAGSVILGFVDMLIRRARTRFLVDLDRFVILNWLPGVAGRDELDAMERQYGALQIMEQTVAGRLSELVEEAGALRDIAEQEIVTALSGVRETLGDLRQDQQQTTESIKTSVQAQESIEQTIEGLSRAMGRQVEEIAAFKDASDARSRELLSLLQTAQSNREIALERLAALTKATKSFESTTGQKLTHGFEALEKVLKSSVEEQTLTVDAQHSGNEKLDAIVTRLEELQQRMGEQTSETVGTREALEAMWKELLEQLRQEAEMRRLLSTAFTEAVRQRDLGRERGSETPSVDEGND